MVQSGNHFLTFETILNVTLTNIEEMYEYFFSEISVKTIFAINDIKHVKYKIKFQIYDEVALTHTYM